MHTRRGWRSNFFPCTPRNKDRKLWKCYCISWHILYPHYIISANWSTLIWKSYGLFQVEEIPDHSSHSWSRQWFRFGLCWSSTSNPCPHWMWYSQQSRYKKQSYQGRSWCYDLLWTFGWDALSNEMIAVAEKFFLKCITKHDVDTFDELRFIVYHKKYLEFDIERFPPTSDNIRQHILRAHICSVLYGYTLLFWKTLTWIHLNMVID